MTASEHPQKRGERADSSIKKLANRKGWRARPTLGSDPVSGILGWNLNVDWL